MPASLCPQPDDRGELIGWFTGRDDLLRNAFAVLSEVKLHGHHRVVYVVAAVCVCGFLFHVGQSDVCFSTYAELSDLIKHAGL